MPQALKSVQELEKTTTARHYSNCGNPPLLDLLGAESCKILDIGCGAGDNARLSRELGFKREFYGITMSASEREAALEVMKECWVEDVENSKLECLGDRKFDAIIFSHVLEHLKDPALVVSRSLSFLSSEGVVLIAVPNILVLRQRIRFLLGQFEYEYDGIMDSTHLRFFTYDSADRYLLSKAPQLRIEKKAAEGGVPLWFLRHHFLSESVRTWIDKRGCAVLPNLFGGQVLIRARSAA